MVQIPIVGGMLIYPLSVAVMAHFFGITTTTLVPSFWLGCGFVLAGVVVKYAVIGIAAVVVAFLPPSVVFSRFSNMTSMIFFCLLPVFHLLPAFFYAGWLSHQF